MRLFFYTTTNELDIFFVSLFPENLDQTLFDPFGILSGLLDICKIVEIQCVSTNVWLNYTCELQTDLILKEDASTAKSWTHPRLSKPLSKIIPIYGNFFAEKTFRKNAASCLK